jgi:Fe-S oxidoreductase
MLSKAKGIDLRVLDSGCCGMAGSWGLHAANDALSRQIGQGLMDRIKTSGAAAAATDCPTCRMQMEQLGPTPVWHPVELVAARLEDRASRRPG